MPCTCGPTSSLTIKLKSCEDDIYEINLRAAQHCGLVQKTIEKMDYTDAESIANMDPIECDKVKSYALLKLIEWCEFHRDQPVWIDDKKRQSLRKIPQEILDKEDEFINELDSTQLFDVFVSANTLEIKCLLDKCAQTVADMVKGKSAEEMRRIWMLDPESRREAKRMQQEEAARTKAREDEKKKNKKNKN